MSIVPTNLTRLGAATLASAALGAATVFLAGAAGGAVTIPTKHRGTHAAPPTTLAGIKAQAAAAVQKRINDLDAAVSRAGKTKGLGDGRTALSAYLSNDIQPLQRQGDSVAADSSVVQAQKDYEDIFIDFRVYHLVMPAAGMAGRADRIADAEVPALTATAGRLEAVADSKNQATIEPLRQDFDHQIAAASSATQGLAATVLAYTPAQWNANYSLLYPEGSALTTANAAIHRARADVVQIRKDLHLVVHRGRAKTLHLGHTLGRRL